MKRRQLLKMAAAGAAVFPFTAYYQYTICNEIMNVLISVLISTAQLKDEGK